MKTYRFERSQRVAKTVLFLAIAFSLTWATVVRVGAASEKSSCVTCHTSSRELIKISQIILKERPPVKSEETKGEG